jgi:hypothetical protein
MKLTPVWRSAVGLAALLCLVMLGLFYYWFALANRYHIFLYGHLGATPFDAITRSRYWMAGLVAAGAAMMPYLVSQWALGRLAVRGRIGYRPPSGWQIWAVAAGPLAVGIVAITTQVNAPVLPLSLALGCVAAAWAGLALAVAPGALLAQRPGHFLWAAWIGGGLAPILQLGWAIELPGRGIVPPQVGYGAAGLGLVSGLAWLIGWTWLYGRWRQRCVPWHTLLSAGLAWSYLVMPLLHYLAFAPPAYRYISASANFFASTPAVQLLTFGMALAALALAGRFGPSARDYYSTARSPR